MPKKLFTANEVANYVVCPESWRLKVKHRPQSEPSNDAYEIKLTKQSWVESQDIHATLKKYGKIAYWLLVALVVVLFLIEQQGTIRNFVLRHGSFLTFFSSDTDVESVDAESQLQEIEEIESGLSIPVEIVIIMVLLAAVIFIWDLFDRQSKKIQSGSGLSESSTVVSAKGSKYLPTKAFVSHGLSLCGTPDALLEDGKQLIPVIIKPAGKKVQDRHVIELLAYMRLIEEENATPCPYGQLLLGKDRRLVKIKNAPEKQRWLESLLDEMESILSGVPAIATPSVQKCRRCDVKEFCTQSAFTGSEED